MVVLFNNKKLPTVNISNKKINPCLSEDCCKTFSFRGLMIQHRPRKRQIQTWISEIMKFESSHQTQNVRSFTPVIQSLTFFRLEELIDKYNFLSFCNASSFQTFSYYNNFTSSSLIERQQQTDLTKVPCIIFYHSSRTQHKHHIRSRYSVHAASFRVHKI